MSRGQSRSTALSGSGEGRGARSAGLTAQPERGQVNRSVWAREATPGHCSKLGGRSGRRTRDINKATREKASGHPHRATPPPPQQPWSRPGPREPPAHPAPPPPRPMPSPIPGCSPREVPRAAHLGRLLVRTARLPAAAAALPATGAAPALRRLPPSPPSRPPGRPALPLRDTALTYAAAATTRPGFPRPGRERTEPLAASRPASQPARRGDTPPARRAHGPRAPSPGRAPARARSAHPLAGGTQWALNKCWSDSSHTCALEPDRVLTPPPPAPTPKSERSARSGTELEYLLPPLLFFFFFFLAFFFPPH